MTHLLDTSAFLAYFFREPGHERVLALFEDDSTVIGLSILSASEFWARLKAAGKEGHFQREWQDHLPLFDEIIPVDWDVTQEAITLRAAASGRLPTIDSLIAATAATRGAVLVHRDSHFNSIPDSLLLQESLG